MTTITIIIVIASRPFSPVLLCGGAVRSPLPPPSMHSTFLPLRARSQARSLAPLLLCGPWRQRAIDNELINYVRAWCVERPSGQRRIGWQRSWIVDHGSWIMDPASCILDPASCILDPALSTLPWLDVHPERRKQARCARRFESFRKTRVWSCRAYVGGGAGMMMAVHCISMRALGPREEDQRAGRLCRKRRSKGSVVARFFSKVEASPLDEPVAESLYLI